MTWHHCSIDIANGVIRYARSPRRLDGLLKEADTDRSLPGEEVLSLAREMASKGYVAMPIGCDHFDNRGYCLGHEEAS
ncbi:hypothetical protein N5J43_08240 [Pseudomonas nicosulfuronedens]|uniref:hypothetical protein n=1 Tax=Pseudomonas nicosulfuronedens TaxID=2571105 RepID=UPI00244AC5BF|nr:hypothetical protein [Pseudomonas nicosulfuronedens]MDH1009962.1 hypothetical protein [Pseudomonas nicosulfuronedens]MDH1978938.1 hypothetical protein [Pseudomonas nicosulfuronedens]MDH2028383.1 hypothetical protein [Pseudomonas nicosulfuronedens]